MAKTAILRGLLASLGLCLASTSAFAWQPSPLKVDFKWQFDFKVTSPYTNEFKNQAPWYTYFPADPRMQAPRPIPFPTWPQQPPVPQQQMTGAPAASMFPAWPHVATTADDSESELRRVSNR